MKKQQTVDLETGEILTEETITTPVPALTTPFFKTPYNYDRDIESLATGLSCKDPSKTQQQFIKDTDLNVILRKFTETGELPNAGSVARYMHVDEEFDLQDQMVTAYQVEEAWNALPAAVRNILKDPLTFSNYVQHCLETGDLEPLEELGLATRQKPSGDPKAPPGDTPAQEAPKPAAAPAAPAT